jgi:cyclophilin family peptidyl-prolyl cis-trans isomerase
METAKGNIVMEMWPDKAPNHVRHILRLASLGVYDKCGVPSITRFRDSGG